MDSAQKKETMTRKNDVVGWGQANAPWAKPTANSISKAIAMRLCETGFRDAFGVLGGGIAPFAAGLSMSPLRFFHFRHEAGAGFAALEAHRVTGKPGLVIVTTGPGIFNVLNAVQAARSERAKLLLVTGFTPRTQVGRGAVQETSLASMPSELLRPGSLFHDVALPETAEELAVCLARLTRGFGAEGPFVAHLGLPLSLQTQLAECPFPTFGKWEYSQPVPSENVLSDCLDRLSDPTSLVWLGAGAEGAAFALRDFVERAELPVVCSPRAKGLFPENHRLFVGVSGAGGSRRVRDHFVKNRPNHVLVIGSRLGEVTSFLSQDLCPQKSFVHVDIDQTAFGAAFPNTQGLGIVSDAKVFAESLLDRAQSTQWFSRQTKKVELPPPAPQNKTFPRTQGLVHPVFLMQTIQDTVVDATDALVCSEAGTSFTWCNAHLRFSEPGRYRTSAAWGSMGHFTTGCVGAALATGRRVVAVVGDGAMLMNNELNTAAHYGANVLWVVLNDAQLGLNEHGMVALGMRPVETQMPRTDFVAFAKSQGVAGLSVQTESELHAAFEQALSTSGPFLLDVAIDPTVPSPVIADRIASLKRQAACG